MRPVTRVFAVLLASLALVPTVASAAEVTRVASSFEDKDPFDLFIDVGFERVQTRMLISRERHTGTEVALLPELRYTGVDTRLNLDLHIGLWHDVEFTFGLPIDFADNETWAFASGRNVTNSTVTNECLQANGQLLDPNCGTTGVGATSLFPISQTTPAQTFRGGIGNLRFGLSYAPFNQNNDDTKPMWVVGLNYEAPTATKLDPYLLTTADTRGSIGDRHHKYTFFTAFSRKMGIADPYFRAYYTLPYKGPQWYSNCDHRDPTVLSYPQNCSTDAGAQWTRAETGLQLPHKVGMVFGSEFLVYDMPEKTQRIALDVRGVTDYVGKGRYYNELSGVLRKMLYTGDYLKFGGQLAINALASDYVSVKASATLLYHTDHYLTDEARGVDLNDDQVVDIIPDGSGNAPEVNPNFDFRFDETSRRFRASQINEFKIDITATFAF